MDSIFKTPLGTAKIVSDDNGIAIISFRTKRKLHGIRSLQGMCDWRPISKEKKK
jgi:hypothetical protein